MRLLGHPRFRAAYDFLVVRGEADPALAELAQWWEQAQLADPAEIGDLLVAPPPAAAEATQARTAPRRRRRRRRPKSSGDDAPASS